VIVVSKGTKSRKKKTPLGTGDIEFETWLVETGRNVNYREAYSLWKVIYATEKDAERTPEEKAASYESTTEMWERCGY
jgi:hypothetical protein